MAHKNMGRFGEGWLAVFVSWLAGGFLLYGVRIVIYKLPVGAVKALANPLRPFFGPIFLFLPLAVGLPLMAGSAFFIEGFVESAPENSFVLGIILLFIGAALCGVPAALTFDPPLPHIKIHTQSLDKVGAAPANLLEGHLVAHSDGFWHVFDEHNELLSIPDTQVLAVRTVEKAGVASAEDTKPMLEKERGSRRWWRWWKFWR